MKQNLLVICFFILIVPFAFADNLDSFNIFCNQNFGAEKEEEMYVKFGTDLRFVTSGEWNYISENSACISFETNIPAKSKIVYGSTVAYSDTSEINERFYFLHIHYLKNLQKNSEYHYKLIAVDERGNIIESEDRTFSTTEKTNAKRIPDDFTSGPPYLLNSPNTYYLVTQDIIAPATVFNITGTGITLDLNGHTIVYNNVAGAPDTVPPGNWGWYATQGPCGIRTADYASVLIVNGIIKQGEGNGASSPASYNPIFLRRPRSAEVAGITVDYSGAQISGIIADGDQRINIHHNVIIDRGTEILNRHSGLDGIFFYIEDVDSFSTCHHNLLKRVRHRGLHAGSRTSFFSNEIYIDSWATNSYGIMYYSSGNPIHDISIYNNKIFGTGFHPVGIGAGLHANDVEVYGNYVQMQGQAPSGYRWPEGPGDPSGQEHPVNCFRFHEGPQQRIHVYDNTFISKARGVPEERAMMRGLWIIPVETIEDALFKNNVIKQEAQNEYADGYAIAALGANSTDTTTVIKYENNIISSNTCNVRFGDNYGHGGKHHFINNTFSRIGNDSRYETIKMGWNGYNYPSYGHTFLDSKFVNGASYESIVFEGANAQRYDFSVWWTLTILSYPRREFQIKDVNDSLIARSNMDSSGFYQLPIMQYICSNKDWAYYTPHKIEVFDFDNLLRMDFTMDTTKTIEVINGVGDDDNSSISRELKIYPNPVYDNFSISSELLNLENIRLFIYNSIGEKIMDIVPEQIVKDDNIILTVSVQNLIPGIYNIIVHDNRKLLSTRVVIMR